MRIHTGFGSMQPPATTQHSENQSSVGIGRGGIREGRSQGNPGCRSTRSIDAEPNTMPAPGVARLRDSATHLSGTPA